MKLHTLCQTVSSKLMHSYKYQNKSDIDSTTSPHIYNKYFYNKNINIVCESPRSCMRIA